MTHAFLAVLLANALWSLAWTGFAVASVLALGGRLLRVGIGLDPAAGFTALGVEVRLGLLPFGAHVKPVFPLRSAMPAHSAPPEAEIEGSSPRDRLAAVVLPMALTVGALGLVGGLPALASVLRGLAQVPFPLGAEGHRLAGALVTLAGADLLHAAWVVAPKVAAFGVIQNLLSHSGFLLGGRAGKYALRLAALLGFAIPAGWLLALARA